MPRSTSPQTTPSPTPHLAFSTTFLPRNMHSTFPPHTSVPLNTRPKGGCRPLRPAPSGLSMVSASSSTRTPAAPAPSDDRPSRLFAGSPVARRAGLPLPDAARLRALGAVLEKDIRDFDPNVTTEDVETRVYCYYLPIYFWMCGMLEEHQATGDRRPLKVGFSCPQGGGKTTMVRFMRRLFGLEGKKCGGASLDDFYLTYREQTEMAEQNWQNGLLRYRGNPGTHDVDLLCRTLDRIDLLNSPCAPDGVTVPQYDKTRYMGRGDRKPDKCAELVPNGLDVFLFEGWCMGFLPVGQEYDFENPDVSPSGDLRLVDKNLEDFARIYDRLDGMLVVEVDDLQCVFDWRAQPEAEAIAAGKPGLTPAQVEDFVRRFMPSYELYTRALYGKESGVFPPGQELHIKINKERKPV